MNDRDVIDSQAFRRWQAYLAFTRGSRHGGEALVKRPNRPLYAGVAVALLVCLGAGIRGLVNNGPPKDWNAEGNLVVDRDAGGRYLVVGSLLRPVLNLTSLKLFTGGSLPPSVEVRHALIATQPHGSPIGIVGSPDEPPTLLGSTAAAPWVACEGGTNEVDILAGVPGAAPSGTASTAPSAPGPANPASPGTGAAAQAQAQAFAGVLARTASDPQVFLVTGAGKFAVGALALRRLGYAQDQVRIVPSVWLAMLPLQATLDLLPLPPGTGTGARPAARFMADGTVVLDTDTGVQYLAGGGELHRILNQTSLLLLGHATVGPVQVADQAIAAQPQGQPFGIPEAPASPPSVPAGTGELFACATTSGGHVHVQVLPRPPLAQGLVQAPLPPGVHGVPGARVRVWMLPTRGVLARPGKVLRAEITPRTPVYLVTGGVLYPVPSAEALSALGYQQDQVQPLHRSWLAALPKGPSLVSLKPGGAG